MKKLYAHLLVISLFLVISVSKSLAQGVAINNSGAAAHPSALLHVDLGTSQTKGFLVTGSFNPSATIPDLGAGTRLMFFPGKAAFRAGRVFGTQWDDANVGLYSTAMGLFTTASGHGSTAIGSYNTASGNSSLAMGESSIASGGNSIAIGYYANASGPNSTALGNSTTANAGNSTAMGYFTTASGYNATALGYRDTASANSSTAMGFLTKATGDYSTAMGYNTTASGILSFAAGTNVSTNNQRGSFFFGDGDPNLNGVRSIGFADQFAARFNGGYYFISSDAGADIGVRVLAGGNAWVAMCDKNRKENFEPVNGEDILKKIKEMKFSSWNYKMQDPATYRHYGVMAQDFFNAFGNDTYGKIGNDTTVNPIDMIGIDMAAIQALEKRTVVLSQENTQLKSEMKELRSRLERLEQKK